jgi:hypothetical protein
VRTVRSVARARNQPRGHLALIVVATLMLLAVLVARANAGPYDDDSDDARLGTPGDATRTNDDGATGAVDAAGAAGAIDVELGVRRTGGVVRGRVYIPISTAALGRVIARSPPVGEVVAAAYRTAGLASDPTPGWRRRSRWSSLVPMISTRAGQNHSWREVDDPTISRGVGLDVRATWHLDHLLFDPTEPRLASLDIARRRERRRVAAIAIHLYYDWISARAAADTDARAELEAHEQTAELDALTDGWFSQALAKRAESR